MADDLAPLIFINGADTKAAQMFTVAGRTSFSESFRLLGIKTPDALRNFADSLG